MFVSRLGMPFGVFVLAHIMMVSCLMMVMCGSVMMSRRLVMMLASRMLCHRVDSLLGSCVHQRTAALAVPAPKMSLNSFPSCLPMQYSPLS
jgi:hypothetical protein